jgi:anti-sigma-K factor RskA
MEGLVGSDFVRIVEDFLDTATRWTEHLANFETAQTEAAPSPQPGQNWIPV